ncbi:MAG TPA: STAS domain-containing protein [Pilimelia sp.]|nr:STAS domain-containing protein [Pilimelia sp.]
MERAALTIVASEDNSGVPTLAVSGEIDMTTVGELARAVEAALGSGPSRLVLDLGEVTFCDSQGLGTLMLLNRQAAGARAVLVLTNVSGHLLRTLDITGLGSLLTIR